MNFLNPYFLLGLLAVAVPVVIHLINLRRPVKLPFSSLSFLQELKKSTIRKIRIKQYLLMALRALAVIFLALALARPYLPPALGGTVAADKPRVVGIIIDNSPSMNRIGGRGPLIEQAREVASTIVNSSRSDDRFIVETTNGEAESVSLSGPSRALEQIEEVEAANTGNYIDDAFGMVYRQLQQATEPQAMIYVITDGQKSQLDKLNTLPDMSSERIKPVSFQLVELEEVSQPNLAVTRLSLSSRMLGRERPLTLEVGVENVGEVPAGNQFLSLELEGRMAGQYKLTLEPGEQRSFEFEVLPDRTGDLSGKVLIEGDEVAYDNRRYFVVRIPESRAVALVGSPGGRGDFKSYMEPALEAARQTNTQIDLAQKTVGEVDEAELLRSDVIVLDGLKEIPEYWFGKLQQYVQEGRGILFLPSEQGDVENYNAFMDLFNAGRYTNVRGEYASFKPIGKMGRLVEGHPVLDDLFEKRGDEQLEVDLPGLFFYYVYSPPGNTGSYTILESESGDPLLADQRFGEGKLLVSAMGADPGWSNFPVNPLFAPLYYRAVLYASSTENGGLQQHVLGRPFTWEGRLQGRDIELLYDEETVKPEVEGLPEGVRVSYDGREWEPGIVGIEGENGRRSVAVNQHIMESRFHTLTHKELDKMLANYVTVHNTLDAGSLSGQRLSRQLNAAGFGKEIWNWFIWIALLLLVAETVASKVYKAENIS